eukprot:TRINITY_DN1616_c0_g1_i4.p1 TRINITY_DN1616_c0_g1~~TRINITY_DN1616_c0_g1_i4.p1  ORF type:complete len:1417 (+),score=326.72 TRINITY_DN1616_c0_g1_i4:457-4251(+)
MGGSNTNGYYGTVGVENGNNLPPKRQYMATWTTPNALYLFGGINGSNVLDDFWTFSLASKNWTWIGGANAPSKGDYPAARCACMTWTIGNQFFLFGGRLFDPLNVLNDLWRYDESGWTRLSSGSNSGQYGIRGIPDASNLPPPRYGAVSWTSYNALYLFSGDNSGSYNDLWKYHIASGWWTWVGGSNTTNQIGVLGNKGSPDINNIPSSRSAAMISQTSDAVYLMGGKQSFTNPITKFNDIWSFQVFNDGHTCSIDQDCSSMHCVSGICCDQICGGECMTCGTGRCASAEGSTCENGRVKTWKMRNVTGPIPRVIEFGQQQIGDAMYLFGGIDTGLSPTQPTNALWRWDPLNFWTLIHNITIAGSYPSPRWGSAIWSYDSLGLLYLFGGNIKYNQPGGYGAVNDLWVFDINALTWTLLMNKGIDYGQMGVYIPGTSPDYLVKVGKASDGKGTAYVFGGRTAPLGSTNTDRVFRWQHPNQWTWMAGSGATNIRAPNYNNTASALSPGSRASMTLHYHPADGDTIIMMGGTNDLMPGNINDVWKFHLDAINTSQVWTPIIWSQMAGPSQLPIADIGFDYASTSTDDGTYYYGGFMDTTSSSRLNTMWKLDNGMTWVNMGNYSGTSRGRGGSAMWSIGDSLFLWGGSTVWNQPLRIVNELWEYTSCDWDVNEPNNLAQSATHLTLIDDAFQQGGLTMCNSYDQDWFVFNVDNVGLLEIAIIMESNNVNADLDFDLFQSPSQVYATLNTTFQGKETYQMYVSSVGRWYMRVYHKAVLDSTYRVDIRSYPSVDEFCQSANHSDIDQAIAIPDRSDMTAEMSMCDQVSYWKFNVVNANANITLSIEWRSSLPYLTMSIFTSSQKRATPVLQVSSGGSNLTGQVLIGSGSYYVRLENAMPWMVPSYTISFTTTDSYVAPSTTSSSTSLPSSSTMASSSTMTSSSMSPTSSSSSFPSSASTFPFASSSTDSNMIIIIASSIGGFVLLSIIIIIIIVLSKRHPSPKRDAIPDIDFEMTTKHFVPNIPGEDIDKKKMLGQGNFGQVYYGMWHETHVALKSLHDIDGFKEFMKESELLKSFNHPNVVRFYGTTVIDGTPWIVTEYCDKGSLKDYVTQHSPTLHESIMFAKGIATGMDALHSKNVVHSDLAIRNVLLHSHATGLQVKVADFGLSKQMENDYYTGSKEKSKPLRWCSPEVISADRFSTASDVWSYGVTVWEILSDGDKPYSQFAMDEVGSAIVNGQKLEKPEKCSDELWTILVECFQTDPVHITQCL